MSYLARAPCVPLLSTLFNRGGSRRGFRLPGEGGDHFHCTVEPSPGHIRCRFSAYGSPVQKLGLVFSAYGSPRVANNSSDQMLRKMSAK